MTAQEIQDAEGFLIVGSSQADEIGSVIRLMFDDERDAVSPLMVIGYATRSEVQKYCKKYRSSLEPGFATDWPVYLKVIAE